MIRRSMDDGPAPETAEGWEMRPGGMLVQRRQTAAGAPLPPEVRLRVSYGAARYEIWIQSVATFGELKKRLETETGLQPPSQRLLYKGKERSDNEYLDVCGVKNHSKVVLVEDPTSLERRYIEMRKNARIQSTYRAISAISLEVDKLAEQVMTLEKSVGSGNKVAEVQITTLIELLMRQAVKLDTIASESEISSQKNLQARRVQKCVETLDMLKISNAKLKSVIVTTKWETFDPPASLQWEHFD